MTVTRGRPTLSLAAIIPDTGTDVGQENALPEIPPLVVQLDAAGKWRPLVERRRIDLDGESIATVGILGFETRLTGDEQGGFLMARRHRYDVREYEKGGKLAGRLEDGAVEMVKVSDDVAERLEKAGRRVDRSQARPRSQIEGVTWSPEGEVLILTKTQEGYALDRWIPALQDRYRLPIEELKGTRRQQMVNMHTGLMFSPAADPTKLLFVPWDYLRDADWKSLADETSKAAPDEPLPLTADAAPHNQSG